MDNNLEKLNTYTLNEVTSSNRDSLISIREEVDGEDREKLEREAVKYTEVDGRKAFIIKDGDRVIGYVEIDFGEEFPLGTPGDTIDATKFAHLARIGRSSDYKDQGIGQKLLQQAEEWAKSNGKTGMWLDYLADNIGAVKLYQTAGYEDIAEFKDIKKIS